MSYFSGDEATYMFILFYEDDIFKKFHRKK